jgi:negative regulator of flagellin synthesis FlgM
MRVDGSTRVTTPTGTDGKASAPAKATGPATSATSQESVSLSGTSSQLQALAAGVSQAADFDASKIESIKQALSDGRYSISSKRIADGLLSSTLDLLAQQKS